MIISVFGFDGFYIGAVSDSVDLAFADGDEGEVGGVVGDEFGGFVS